MKRIVAVALLGVATSAFTIGTVEPGPSVPVSLPSGRVATFDTWVNVAESRMFEAVRSVEALTQSDTDLEAIPKAARAALDPVVTAAKADSVFLHVMTRDTADLAAFSCVYKALERQGRCYRH